MAAENAAAEEINSSERCKGSQEMKEEEERFKGEIMEQRGKELEEIAGVEGKGLADHFIIGEKRGVGEVFKKGNLDGLVSHPDLIARAGDLNDGQRQAKCDARPDGDGAFACEQWAYWNRRRPFDCGA